MQRFSPQALILLSEQEIQNLASAVNRGDFQPHLSHFLYATGNLKGLRRLALEPETGSWTPPTLTLQANGSIVDAAGRVRGHRESFHLPPRPGEPQMSISYDWFWSEFCTFLRHKKVWAETADNQWLVIWPDDVTFSAEKEWENFWCELSSQSHLEKSLEIFLNHKTLFKKPASAWASRTIPILSRDMAEYLREYYEKGEERKKLFKESSLTNAISDLKTILDNADYAHIPFPVPVQEEHVRGGDFTLPGRQAGVKTRCLACGEIITKKDGYERRAIFIKDADERPQSGRRKDDRSYFCSRCVATVFLCPVKLTPETLAVKFLDQRDRHSTPSQRPIEMELRKFVAHSLDISAGHFVALHITEKIKKEKKTTPLCEELGAYHYALWKMADTFDPELFAQGFSVEVYPGEEKFSLPRWSLWLVAALAKWNEVFHYHCYAKKEFRPHFSQFLRLVSQKKVFQSFYTLISGDPPLVKKDYAGSYKMDQLQNIWSELQIILEKEEKMPIPDYPKIAGMVGLLLPLASCVQNKAHENDKKRAISKLLEEVDRPIQYAYRAARESGKDRFFFGKKPGNRYFFEKAVELLSYAGENTAELLQKGEELAGEKYEQKMWIGPDQIARVTAALVSEGKKPYANEAHWRDFAYQVKLALWSMFPQYLGSQD